MPILPGEPTGGFRTVAERLGLTQPGLPPMPRSYDVPNPQRSYSDIVAGIRDAIPRFPSRDPVGVTLARHNQAAAEQAARTGPLPPSAAAQSAPAAPLAGGAGGGGGGAGGGTAVASSAWLQQIEEARQMLRSNAAQLQSQYEQDRDELRDLFNFAETPEEQAQLAFALGDLKRQRDEAIGAIASGYAATQGEVRGRGKEAAKATRGEAAAVGDLFRDAAADIAASGDDAAEMFAGSGVAVNAGGGPTSQNAYADLVAAAAPREQALSQRMGDLTVEDINWLADSLGGESQAHQSDARRLTSALLADTQARHQAQVGDRINNERMAFAQQLAGLQGDFRGRGFDVQDQEVALLQQLAQMQMQEAQAAAARAGGGGRGGGGGGAPKLDMLTQLLGPEGAQQARILGFAQESPFYGDLLQGLGHDIPPELTTAPQRGQERVVDRVSGIISNILGR